jgi:hypothetical protein
MPYYALCSNHRCDYLDDFQNCEYRKSAGEKLLLLCPKCQAPIITFCPSCFFPLIGNFGENNRTCQMCFQDVRVSLTNLALGQTVGVTR